MFDFRFLTNVGRSIRLHLRPSHRRIPAYNRGRHGIDVVLHMHHVGFMTIRRPVSVEDLTKEVTQNCLLTRTRRIARVMTGIYDHELRPFGINSPQFTLLVIISRLGPVTRSEIGRENHQERSTLSRNLKVLLSECWVEEVRHDDNGRSRPIALTQAGKNLLRSAAAAWRRAQTRARTLLGGKGVTAVTSIANDLPQRETS